MHIRQLALALSFLMGSVPLSVSAQDARLSDPEIFEVGREAPRAYFLPADATSGTDASPFVMSLNGMWRFAWSPQATGAPANFMSRAVDDSSWDEIPVPSNVELHG